MNESLTWVDLSNNFIGDKGALALVDALFPTLSNHTSSSPSGEGREEGMGSRGRDRDGDKDGVVFVGHTDKGGRKGAPNETLAYLGLSYNCFSPLALHRLCKGLKSLSLPLPLGVSTSKALASFTSLSHSPSLPLLPLASSLVKVNLEGYPGAVMVRTQLEHLLALRMAQTLNSSGSGR